jgi:SAM-dependent methyltransferase
MPDAAFWDARYGGSDYFYGTEPNTFLADHAHLLAGPVLSLAEGEGRNAVFLAGLGLSVLGVDRSDVGLRKARALADARGVTIETCVADLAGFEPPAHAFGAVVSISAHLPDAVRRVLYPRVERALRPGGVLLLEAYAEGQLGRDTGGPQNLELLMSEAKLRAEFPALTPVLLREIDRDVREGTGHTGLASVVQFIARKDS